MAGCTSKASEVEEVIDSSIPVHTDIVKTDLIQENYFGIGSLKAKSEFEVLSDQSGTVKVIYVQVGDRVEKGQVLMEVENETLLRNSHNTESSFKTQLDSVGLTLKTAKEAYEQTMVLYPTGAVSENDVKTVTTALRQAELSYSNAKTNYELTIKNEHEKVADTLVRSPISGIVAASYVTIGQEIEKELVFKVINKEKMIATVDVTSDAIDLIELGSSATIYYDGDRDQAIEGTVTRINEVTGQQSFMFPVEIEIENSQKKLRSGDYIESKIVLEERNDVITIPKYTVLNFLANPQVYVSNNGVAELRSLKLGYTNGKQVEVLSGLSIGEHLVTQGQDFLEDGTPLRITNQ